MRHKIDSEYKTTRETPHALTPELRGLMKRRTDPFLNYAGLSTRSISHLMQEAYLQGLTDACDAYEHKLEAGK